MDSKKSGPKPEINTFGFIDETGLLTTPKEDQVFGLGLLKLQHPATLHKTIERFKTRENFQKEFKFTDVTNFNLRYYKGLINLYLNLSPTYFSCIVIDKSKLDTHTYFKKDYLTRYNMFVAKIITDALDISEYIAVLADDISTPKSDNFEQEIKNKVKLKSRRNALFGICRIDSHAVSEIQMVDVLLGTVAYAFKIKLGLIEPNRNNAKFRLLKYLQKHLNVDFLAETKDFRMRLNRRFVIHEFKGTMTKNADSAVSKTTNDGGLTHSARN